MKNNLWASTTAIDKTNNARCGGDPAPFETFTHDMGVLYRDCRKEYGRCVSHVYQDKTSGETLCIGWVFLKRFPYDDGKGSFLCETWVTVLTGDPDEPGTTLAKVGR